MQRKSRRLISSHKKSSNRRKVIKSLVNKWSEDISKLLAQEPAAQ